MATCHSLWHTAAHSNLQFISFAQNALCNACTDLSVNLPHSCCCSTRFAVIVQVITVDADAQLTAVGAVEHSPGVKCDINPHCRVGRTK